MPTMPQPMAVSAPSSAIANIAPAGQFGEALNAALDEQAVGNAGDPPCILPDATPAAPAANPTAPQISTSPAKPPQSAEDVPPVVAPAPHPAAHVDIDSAEVEPKASDKTTEDELPEEEQVHGVLHAAVGWAPATVAVPATPLVAHAAPLAGSSASAEPPRISQKSPDAAERLSIVEDAAVQLRIRVEPSEPAPVSPTRDQKQPVPASEKPTPGSTREISAKPGDTPEAMQPEDAPPAVAATKAPPQKHPSQEQHQREPQRSAERATEASQFATSSPAPAGRTDNQPSQAVRVPSMRESAQGPAPEAQPTAALHHEPIAPEPQLKPALRTMSFELGQEGGSEVKLRLSERSGEVHVSLHSADASLNHQLRERIHDLTSVLSNAGYETESREGGQWTGQEREQRREQRQPTESDTPRTPRGGGFFDKFLSEIPLEVR
jgi:hypothetical protein